MPEPNMFLDEGDFDKLNEAMKEYDEKRDTIIKRSRDILKSSKVAIYCLHRGEIDKAEKNMEAAEEVADELAPLISDDPALRGGSYSAGMEEYAEAMVFLHFIKHGSLPLSTDLPRVQRDEFLGGVLDFTVGRCKLC